jgi:fructose-1,6-bisphosphatase/inositol monophosphatase family enzyme
MPIDIARVGALMREVAAEEILPRFQKLAAEDVREKRPGNLVTTADLAAEARLINGLSAIAPAAAFVAEEMAEADPTGVLARLAADTPVWVIDPVDGTANFADGKTDFAVIVAYVEGSVTRAGWILEPVKDALTTAEEGGGTFRDGERLSVRGNIPLKQMTGSLGYRLRHDRSVTAQVGPLLTLKSAGCEHVALSSGRFNFALYRRSMPWDHAAGVLMHREAGGYSAALDGTPYSPAGGPQQGVLLAPDRDTWQRLHDLVAPKLVQR